MKEMDGLDYSTSGGTGLDGIDSNHGGAESVIRGSGSANQSRATRAVGARSQLAATLRAVGQSGLVSKPFAEASGKKGFGCCTSQSTDCSGRANCIQNQAQWESPAE